MLQSSKNEIIIEVINNLFFILMFFLICDLPSSSADPNGFARKTLSSLEHLNTSSSGCASKLKNGCPDTKPNPSSEWYAKNVMPHLKKAILSKKIRYFVVRDPEYSKFAIEQDFERALSIWLKSIEQINCQIIMTNERSSADIIIHVGTESISTKHEWSGRSQNSFIKSTADNSILIPLIELNGLGKALSGKETPWTTVSEALANKAVAWSRDENGDNKIPISDIFSRTKNIIDGKSVLIDTKPYVLVYGTLIHELGHSFGLQDGYDPKTQIDCSGTQSVMGNKKYKLIEPSLEDKANVKEIFNF